MELNWQPDDAPADTGAGGKPDIFAAVEQQAGLKLAILKTPLDVLMVDKCASDSGR